MDLNVKEIGLNFLKSVVADKHGKQAALAKMRTNPRNFDDLPDKLKKDRDIVLEAVKNRVLKLSDVDVFLRGDREIVLEAIKNAYDFDYSLQYAADNLKKDREVVLAAVKKNGSNIRFADDTLKKDREIVLTALKNSEVLFFVDASLKADREIVLEAIKGGCGEELESADDSLKKDADFVLSAVKIDGLALKFADDSLKKDPEFQKKCFEASFFSYKFMINPQPELKTQFNQIISDLKALNIDIIERFSKASLAEIKEIINNRRLDFLPADNRPRACVVFSKVDESGALNNNNIITLLRNNYRVSYFEAEKDLDLVGAIQETGKKQEISLLVIAGHGDTEPPGPNGPSEGWTNFGAVRKKRSEPIQEIYYLDSSDKEKLAGLEGYLKKDAAVILESCFGGFGGKSDNNVANLLKEAFPGRRIFAPKFPMKTLNFAYEFDENKKIKNVNFSCGEKMSYKIEEK